MIQAPPGHVQLYVFSKYPLYPVQARLAGFGARQWQTMVMFKINKLHGRLAWSKLGKSSISVPARSSGWTLDRSWVTDVTFEPNCWDRIVSGLFIMAGTLP
jgi:hypothetical protein